MPTTTDLLTVAEVARERGKHIRTVHRMVAAGRLVPALRLPGKTGALLFTREDVEKAFSEKEKAS